MSFVYPSFLWALGVLAIPLIIHLFNFRKTTRIYFSNNRFLKQVKEATTAKRKLKHYLILAARLLFLFFLVITFCQPILPAKEQLGNTRNVILYLDNSQSMSAHTDEKRRAFETSMEFVNNIVALFPPDTRYKLLTNDFAPFSNSYKTKGEVQELLTQIRFSSVSRTLQEVIDKIQQNNIVRNHEVFWISDFQKATLGKVSSIDSALRYHLVPVTLAKQSNIFVDTCFLDNPFAASGEKNVLRLKVRNDGTQDVDQLNLKLTINNIQAAATTVSVPRAGVNETSFDLAHGLSGLNEAKISFNDFPVSFDNEFYVALNFTDKIRVIEIRTGDVTSPIEKVFGNKQVFDYKGYSVSNFNYSLLPQADLVVVNGLNLMDASLNSALHDYINNNGTILIVPGTNPGVAYLRSLTALPGLTTVETKVQAELDRPDFSNPFFENVFEEKSVSLAMPKANPVIVWGNDRNAILRFKNDQPFLSSFNLRGKVYLMASPLDPGFTDFFNHALFVPVMYRIAASSKKNENKLYYTLKENFLKLTVDSIQTEAQLKLIGEEEIIPSQRNMGNSVMLDLPKYSVTKGFYKVASGKDTVGLLAFNLEKGESLLAQYTGAEVKTMLGSSPNISIFQSASADAFSNEIKERYLGTPLWKYALLLALLFLLAEVLLIRFLK